MEKNRDKICVAMSGGIDSSVAAYLLQQGGAEVVGVTMYLGTHDEKESEACGGLQVIKDARAVCDKLAIPHYVLDLSSSLYKYVITDFIDEYCAGRTPNPCVRCNKYLKFGALYAYARSLGFEIIATGHYARLGAWQGKKVLMRNRDTVKDQSYFLYGLAPSVLESVIFPLAEFTKNTVREIAHAADLPVFSKTESQEICFVTDHNYRNFLHRNGICDHPGRFVDIHGKVVGSHNGIFNYTIGQRKGLGIALGTPCYVVAVDASANTVIVGSKQDLYASGCDAWKVNMFVDIPGGECTAKVRYTQKDIPCIAMVEDGILRVSFVEPVESVTPGQSIVLYLGDVVLGGGVIRNVYRHHSQGEHDYTGEEYRLS